jgi:bifunctional non-homologous end joining protein LigD
MKKVSFICQEGGSNKEYHIQMVPKDSGFVINFQYGAIGSTLKPGSKTPSGPVDEAAANKLFESLIKERLRKGYTQVGEAKASGFSAEVVTEKKTHGIFPQLLNPIEEDEVMKYINDDDYVSQEKKDGERRMAIKEPKHIIGLNKKGQEVQLIDLVVKSIKDEGSHAKSFVIDGEIIGEILHVFDILSLNGESKVKQPYIGRLNLLGSMKFGPNVVIVKTAYTRAEKLKMYNDLKAANAEGIVFKRKDSLHSAGRPNSGGPHLKNKFYKEASFIVKDVTKGKRSVGLELLNEGGERVHMGKCTIPPNKEIPKVGDVVEVRYLYAYKGGCIFQPAYKEQRNDVDVEECLMAQIIYKAGQSDEEE